MGRPLLAHCKFDLSYVPGFKKCPGGNCINFSYLWNWKYGLPNLALAHPKAFTGKSKSPLLRFISFQDLAEDVEMGLDKYSLQSEVSPLCTSPNVGYAHGIVVSIAPRELGRRISEERGESCAVLGTATSSCGVDRKRIVYFGKGPSLICLHASSSKFQGDESQWLHLGR